jgi:hypothetical protein
MSTKCQIEAINVGGAYPRGCPTCGPFGKCVKGLEHPFKKPAHHPTPADGVLTEDERRELLDWVSACQSAYHIESTPGHRFGGIPSALAENREARHPTGTRTSGSRAEAHRERTERRRA